MLEAMIGLASGLGGAIMGSYVAWWLAARSGRRQTRRDALVKAWQDAEVMRLWFSQWYESQETGFYVLVGPKVAGGFHDARQTIGTAFRLAMEQAKSAILFDRVAIRADLPKKVAAHILPLLDEIIRLADTIPRPSVKDVTDVVDKAEKAISSHLKGM